LLKPPRWCASAFRQPGDRPRPTTTRACESAPECRRGGSNRCLGQVIIMREPIQRFSLIKHLIVLKLGTLSQ
jgi:hypothetical protein